MALSRIFNLAELKYERDLSYRQLNSHAAAHVEPSSSARRDIRAGYEQGRWAFLEPGRADLVMARDPAGVYLSSHGAS